MSARITRGGCRLFRTFRAKIDGCAAATQALAKGRAAYRLSAHAHAVQKRLVGTAMIGRRMVWMTPLGALDLVRRHILEILGLQNFPLREGKRRIQLDGRRFLGILGRLALPRLLLRPKGFGKSPIDNSFGSGASDRFRWSAAKAASFFPSRSGFRQKMWKAWSKSSR